MSSEQEKVEMEQVPLKSDTDAPASEEAAAAPAAEAAPKKGWFFGKKAKKAASEPEAEAEEKPEESKEEKPKKKCWWTRAEKSETEQKAEHISIGMNLVDRDEKAINEHARFGFEDIFGEPDTTHSWDCIWRLVFKIFTWTRLFVYRLGALVVGIPAAIILAICFGLTTVLNTFVCVPFGKLLSIPANLIAKVWNWLVHAIMDPLASSCGLCFSQFTIRQYGINSQPTDPCVA